MGSVVCLYYSKCDTLSLQVMALWQTVTQRTSMLQRVQSAFNQPILQLYLTFQPLKDHEALLHVWNWGRSINCHFLITILAFCYMFISKFLWGVGGAFWEGEWWGFCFGVGFFLVNCWCNETRREVRGCAFWKCSVHFKLKKHCEFVKLILFFNKLPL